MKQKRALYTTAAGLRDCETAKLEMKDQLGQWRMGVPEQQYMPEVAPRAMVYHRKTMFGYVDQVSSEPWR